MRDYPTIHLDKIKVKEQLVVRKDMDVNEHERLSNITLMFNYIHILSCYKLFLYFNLYLKDYPTLHLDTNESEGYGCK